MADERVVFAGDLSGGHLNHEIVVEVPETAAFPCRVQGELVGIHHARAARTLRPIVVVAIGGPCPDSPWGPEWRPFVLDPDWKVTVAL